GHLRRAPSGAHSCCLDGVCEGNSREARECTYKTFRNQACYDAARSLNVQGMSVQVRRGKCFEKACQALWPGEA
ncbi:unnamed protein product, partial [Pylaiella littoralis]